MSIGRNSMIAFALWVLSGLVGGWWLGLLLGGRPVTLVFGLTFGVGMVLIAAEWMLALSGKKENEEAVKALPAGTNHPVSASTRVKSDHDLLPEEAREWLDEFLLEQQEKD